MEATELTHMLTMEGIETMSFDELKHSESLNLLDKRLSKLFKRKTVDVLPDLRSQASKFMRRNK